MEAPDFSKIAPEELVELASRSLMTIDGLWFLAAEEAYGLDAAIDMDVKAWEAFAPIQARRVMKTFGIGGNGIGAIVDTVKFDPLWKIFKPVLSVLGENKVVLRLTDCPPQKARLREGRGEFPCKPVGIACFTKYAEAIDPRARIRCAMCPPDAHPPDVWCEWWFEV